jgi:hypothetical protein
LWTDDFFTVPDFSCFLLIGNECSYRALKNASIRAFVF